MCPYVDVDPDPYIDRIGYYLRYKSQKHSQHGYFILFVAVFLSLWDIVVLVRRFVAFLTNSDRKNVISKHFWRTVILGHEEALTGSSAEYASLVSDEPEEFEDVELKSGTEPLHIRRNQAVASLQTLTESLPSHDRTVRWTNKHRYHQDPQSPSSERTLLGFLSPTKLFFHDTLEHSEGQNHPHPKQPLAYQIVRIVFSVMERSLVFAGFCQLLTGMVVYTGGCRENYINGCLAHLISTCYRPAGIV